MQVSTKTAEEVVQAKQKANRKYKANKAKRENLIRVLLRICFWFTDFFADRRSHSGDETEGDIFRKDRSQTAE